MLTDAERDMSYQPKEFPVQQVLELACAAQRVNGSYVKDGEAVYDEDGKFLHMKPSNKTLIQLTLNTIKWNGDMKDHPPLLRVKDEDKDQAIEIQKYFRRLMFAAIEGENDFKVNINSILSSEMVKENMFGYVACLPMTYVKDRSRNLIAKKAKDAEVGYLAEVGVTLFDLDCEILESTKSKNYEGYNISAIINNKMVSWMSKAPLQLGDCVVVKAKVKDHSSHWLHKVPVTRLNYVKAAQ